MARKVRKGESRDLRNLRKLAHERAARIDSRDRPRIDLEDVLGVPIAPVDSEAVPGTTADSTDRAVLDARVSRDAPAPAAGSGDRMAPARRGSAGAERFTEPTGRLARGRIKAAAGIGRTGREPTRDATAPVGVEQSRPTCIFQLLAELHLSTVAMVVAPLVSWSQIQQQAANCYVKAVQDGIDGMQEICSAVGKLGWPVGIAILSRGRMA
jgi:hypothetical protein